MTPIRCWRDRLFRFLCRVSALSIVLLGISIILVLAGQSWPALARVAELNLLTSTEWNPDQGNYGVLGFLYGTLITSTIAMMLALPLGMGAAIYLAEIAPARVRQLSSFFLELLAAIPSVVYGFWAKAFLARVVVLPLMIALELPGVQVGLGGQSMLTAGLILAIMILPYITAVSYEVCRAVPVSARESAYALGATRWQTIRLVVLPAARAGMIAGGFLALSRALGETMAVAMVIGNSDLFQWSPAAPGDSMSSVIAKLLHETSSHGPERAVLISLGFLLMLIAFTSNLFARRLVVWIAQRSVSSEGLSFSISSETQDEFLMEGSARRRRNAQRVDRLMSLLLGFCQLLTMIPLFLILGFVAYQGISAINWNILLQLPPPIDEPGGLGHALLGSTMLVGMAAVWTIPLSLLAATLLVEFRSSRLCRPLRFTSETLGGIPSIVVGIFAYSVLVSPFWWPRGQFGFSAWAGAFALGMIMLPILIRMAEESLLLVPRGLREASYALGATQWQTVSRVLLPAALPAILTGILLAIGRAVGEAAPLLLTSRGSNFWPRSPAEPTASLPYFINEFSQQIGQPEFERLGWAGAFLLLVSIFCINMMTRVLAGRRPILY